MKVIYRNCMIDERDIVSISSKIVFDIRQKTRLSTQKKDIIQNSIIMILGDLLK